MTEPARTCPTCGSDCNERDELIKAEREIERLRKDAARNTARAAIKATDEPAKTAAANQPERGGSPQAWGPGQFVVVATFRYCLGRQTYIVQECADWLLLHWPEIEQPARNLIQYELECAFEQDDKARAGEAKGYKPLGWNCDRQQWERVRSLWASV